MTAPFRNVPHTGFNATLGAAAANVPGTTGALVSGESRIDPVMSQLMRRRGFRGYRRLLRTLVGAAAGNSAAENTTRMKAAIAADVTTTGQGGGLITMETVSLVPSSAGGSAPATRNTTATDVTYFTALIDRLSALAPASYPADLSGNAGGGKLGF